MTTKSWLGVMAIGLGSLTMMACAAPSEGAVGGEREHLASAFENLEVEGVVNDDGTVSVDARSANGEHILSILVSGDAMTVDFFESYRRGSAVIAVPRDRAAKLTLVDWNGLASYLAKSVTVPHKTEGGAETKPQMFGTCPWSDLWCQPNGAYWSMAEWWNTKVP